MNEFIIENITLLIFIFLAVALFFLWMYKDIQSVPSPPKKEWRRVKLDAWDHKGYFTKIVAKKMFKIYLTKHLYDENTIHGRECIRDEASDFVDTMNFYEGNLIEQKDNLEEERDNIRIKIEVADAELNMIIKEDSDKKYKKQQDNIKTLYEEESVIEDKLDGVRNELKKARSDWKQFLTDYINARLK